MAFRRCCLARSLFACLLVVGILRMQKKGTADGAFFDDICGGLTRMPTWVTIRRPEFL